MGKLKQLFCKHEYAWTNPRHFIKLSGDMPENKLKCRKCGKVKEADDESR